MNFKVYLLLLLLCCCQVKSFEKMAVAESLFVIISNPSKFYNKVVLVSGFATVEPVIYPTKELSKFGIKKNGLRLDIKDLDDFESGYIAVVGRLCKTKEVTPVPYLCDITRVSLLPWDKKVTIKSDFKIK